nr:hypothetical protein [Desmonostoc muscorum]
MTICLWLYGSVSFQGRKPAQGELPENLQLSVGVNSMLGGL